MNFLIVPLFFISLSINSQSEVKVNIFAKYIVTEFEIQFEQARIFHLEKEKTLEKGLWKVSIENGIVYIRNKNFRFYGKDLLLIPNGFFSIFLNANGKKINRRYQGKLEFYSIETAIILVLKIPLEKYVASATRSELGDLYTFLNQARSRELLASQEIVIRTFILKEKKRHSKNRFDFCDLTHCIHFAGIYDYPTLYPSVILSGESTVNGYFHSTCGGYLSGPEVFWQKHEISPHYRRGKDELEANCKYSPHFNWEATLKLAEFEEIAEVNGIETVKLELKAKRVTGLIIKNFQNEITIIPISRFLSKTGKIHGWNKIKSNFFKLEKEEEVYRFKGHGLGHGVGLCQWGATNLAANGKSYKEILEFYFPRTELKELVD